MTVQDFVHPSTLRRTRAESLRGLCGGAVYLPGDPGFDDARTAWNVAVDQRPAAVAYPATAVDVFGYIAHGRLLAEHNVNPFGGCWPMVNSSSCTAISSGQETATGPASMSRSCRWRHRCDAHLPKAAAIDAPLLPATVLFPAREFAGHPECRSHP